MIRINHLTFAYDKRNIVLNDINIEADSHKITALLGHNGAGKTTLFRCILGLLIPQEGEVKIKIRSNHGNNHSPIISYMPDSGGFYPLLSPLDNLVFRASFYKDKKAAKKAAQYWLEKLKLNKSKVKFAGEMSHGMQKRLSFACAMISDPVIILLDEPTNGLDPLSIDILINLIREINKEDTTILINTHDLNLVREVCHKIIFLQEGMVIGENEVKDIEKKLREYYLETYNSNEGECND